ncbi:WxL domain-containing protein [Candidatus Enterococcus clewellii]|uniref:WxL domain-containing protein n=2 Tax=Candidatus Enterococcus clewellii TaxID=1834193 RepID=A0A242JZ64_9ENTE|nr:WxL domain-containing protein [Enterococcus sp. 9E7_DIV0242]OTP10512.1 hypothetical protein A5888_003810 [Enterococcus sp. 9E7_DIV0242]
MKNTHKLCGAALLAVIGFAVAAPSATQADTSVKGDGIVEFEKGTTKPVTPPDTDGPVLPYPPANPDPSDLKIVAVTPLDFEKHAILADGSSQDYDVKAFNDANFGDMENFVEFIDNRVDGTDNTYKIEAEMTQQFTQGSSVLTGSTLTYKNVRVATNGTDGENALAPLGVEATPDALELNQKVLFLNHTDATSGRGFGQYKLAFGKRDIAADAEGSAQKSVTLTVPGTVAKKVGVYKAEITWSITAAP